MVSFLYRSRNLVWTGLIIVFLMYIVSVSLPRVETDIQEVEERVAEEGESKGIDKDIESINGEIDMEEEKTDEETENEEDTVENTEEENVGWTEEDDKEVEEGTEEYLLPIGSQTRECITWKALEPSSSFPQNQAVPDWIKKKTNHTYESSQHRKDSFAMIWDKHGWGSPSRSGSGSLLQNTVSMRHILSVLVERIKSVLGKDELRLLDSSCGDMSWMPTFLGNRSDIIFTGYDIVPGNINNHKKNFAGKPWKFELHDLVLDPISKFDIILSRHTLQHLTNGDIKTVLSNFLSSESNFLLTTNFDHLETNTEIDTAGGRYRPINLLLPPYSLPQPVCSSWDDCGTPEVYIALWDLRTMRHTEI